MTKKEFETTDEPLCMIVSLDPSTGKVFYDTYDWRTQGGWLEDFRKDFPKMMHFFKLNSSAIRERQKILIQRVSNRNEITISKQEYEALKRDSDNLNKVSFSM